MYAANPVLAFPKNLAKAKLKRNTEVVIPPFAKRKILSSKSLSLDASTDANPAPIPGKIHTRKEQMLPATTDLKSKWIELHVFCFGKEREEFERTENIIGPAPKNPETKTRSFCAEPEKEKT